MYRESGACASRSFTGKSITATRRTASLAEVLEAVARESKAAIVALDNERTGPVASSAAGMLQQQLSTSRSKNDPTVKSGLAARSGTTSSVSILLLFTVSVVTAGFVICAVAVGRYISSGEAFGSWRVGDRSVRNFVLSMNLLAPARAPALATESTGEELEAEEMARRYMIQPDNSAASEGGAVESRPPTEPFKDIDGTYAKVRAVTGRKAPARTSIQPASEPKTDDGVPPNASASGQRLNPTLD